MNPTAIEWTHIFGPGSGFTWNPLVGCTYGCSYCYARRQAKRQKHNCQLCYEFTPHLHEERLEQPLHRRKPAGIFLGSMTDLYGPEVPQKWRVLVWETCAATPQHQYFVLTKQPQAINDNPPENVLLGFSAVCQHHFDACIGEFIEAQGARQLMVSLEPLFSAVEIIGMGNQDWLILGAQTGPGAVLPTRQDVEATLASARQKRVPCFVKNSLAHLAIDRPYPVEWPEVLR